MKKLLLILCLLLALTCLFVACDEGGDTTPNDDSQNEEQNGETPEGEETPENEENPAPHSHSWSAWATTQAATCTAKGEQKRTCACGESETQEVALKQHSATHREAAEETCTAAGNIEYWECTDCDCYFSDEDCTNKVIDIAIAASHQAITHHEAVAAGEATAGNIEYWECTACGKYFSDATGTVEITDKNSVILPILAHAQGVITHYAAVAPSCVAEGNIEYWSCSHCGKYFSDAGCTQEIADKASVILPATGHQSARYHDRKAESCGVAGNLEYWECLDCGKYFSDAHCTTEITDKFSVVIPATGGCVYNTQNVCTVCNTALQYTEGLEYTLNSDGESYTVTKGTALNNTTDIVIPWYHEEKPVTSIGEDAFSYCYSLRSITIPSGVTSIGDYAFYYCYSLDGLTIPAGMTSIGASAFFYCSSLTSVTFGENSQCTSIGDYAFWWCESLTSITIPASVTSIGEYAFYYCRSLTSVTFESTAGWWYASSSTAASGTSISSDDLSNASTAATYLRSTYYNYYWKRTV